MSYFSPAPTFPYSAPSHQVQHTIRAPPLPPRPHSTISPDDGPYPSPAQAPVPPPRPASTYLPPYPSLSEDQALRAYTHSNEMPLLRPRPPSKTLSDANLSRPQRQSSLPPPNEYQNGADDYFPSLPPPGNPFPTRPSLAIVVANSQPLVQQFQRQSFLNVISSGGVTTTSTPDNDMMSGQYPYPSPPASVSSSSISSLSAGGGSSVEPPRTYPLPTFEKLQQRASTLDTMSDGEQISWAQDVVRAVDRQLHPSGAPTDFTHPDQAPITHHLPTSAQDLLEMAIPIIVTLTTSQNTRAAALASYLRAKLQSAGLCQDLLPKNQRQAFKDFEFAARGGEVRGWYRLGRDYEGVNDLVRAKDCFERGVKRGDCECAHRMGMAHLLGQLKLPSTPSTALSLLRQASELSNVDFPQPSYVYGMLLAGELSIPTEIPPSLVLPPSSSPSEALSAQHNLAREAIEKAAYLNYPPAQYKAGFLYEHAALNAMYDPLVSVNWYTFASKGGEMEADMALSKWFLCGAEGHFPKNEQLARTFAEKAARKGHPNGCFALGYYYEIGVGGRKDLDQARRWYQKAANLGNGDAPGRLSALSGDVPSSISMAEHESRLNDTLVRKRTQAKIRSDRNSISRPQRRSQQLQPLPQPGAGGWQQQYRSEVKMGEIMSPIPNNPNPYNNNHNGGFPTSNSFPRPPITQHAFTAPSSSPSIGQNQNQNQGGRRFSSAATAGGAGGLSNSTSLSDLSMPIPDERRGSAPAGASYNTNTAEEKRKGPQTFAEMGFVSKPVEEEGCLIM